MRVLAGTLTMHAEQGQSSTKLLLVSGSTRAGSTNTALLRTAQVLAPQGVTTDLYDGMSRLPHFNPDDDHDPLDPEVADLRARIAAATAVLLCTPEYAAALPGSFKNLLDWTVGGAEIYGKPVAWVNVSAGADDAYASLAKVLDRVGADTAHNVSQRIPVTRHMIGADGLITDTEARNRLSTALDALARHATAWPRPPA